MSIALISLICILSVLFSSCAQFQYISTDIRIATYAQWGNQPKETVLEMKDPDTEGWYEAEKTTDGHYQLTEKGKKLRDDDEKSMDMVNNNGGSDGGGGGGH